MLDFLTRHADVVGDLIDIVSLLSAGKNAGATQAVYGRVIGIIGIDVQSYFLTCAPTHSFHWRQITRPWCVRKPSAPAGAKAVGGVLRGLR